MSTGRDLVAVDTNVLLRATLNEAGLEAQSTKARQIVASGRWDVLVADVTMAEFVHALEAHYGFDRPLIADLVLGVVRLDHVVAAGSIITAALTHYVGKPKLSFDDCFIAEHARAHRAQPLWTFDRKLARQHDQAVLIDAAA